jgi:4'-phosphopantetheinyl transferase
MIPGLQLQPLAFLGVSGALTGIRAWLLDVEAARGVLPQCEQLLDPEERIRAARFHFERDRHAFVMRRAALRCLLAEELGLQPAQVRFQLGSHGKPALVGEPELHFNVSHSGQLALFGMAQRHPLGVDVEEARLKPDLIALADRILTAAEMQEFRALSANDQLSAFYQYWTRKEAVVKALGLGLSLEPDQVQVALPPRSDLGRRPTAIHGPGGSSLELMSLQPRADYWAAVAVLA